MGLLQINSLGHTYQGIRVIKRVVSVEVMSKQGYAQLYETCRFKYDGRKIVMYIMQVFYLTE